MTISAMPVLFRPPTRPAQPELTALRVLLLDDAPFLAGFREITQPAAVLSTCHQLVLANDRLLAWLEVDSDENLVGAFPADLQLLPGSPDLVARTRFVECRGRGFFILTIHPTGA